MTRPKPDEQATTVLPAQTVEQPSVTTAPPTRRAGLWSHVPARIGRARTSTVVIACLFVLLFALNSALPREDEATSPVVLPSGQTIQVRNSDLPDDYVPPTTAPATTAPAPATTGAPATTTVPRTTTTPRSTSAVPAPDDEDETTAPETTEEEPSEEAPATSSAPSSSRASSSSAARSSAAPSS